MSKEGAEFRDRAVALRRRLVEQRAAARGANGHLGLAAALGPRVLRAEPGVRASVVVVVRNGEDVIGRCLDCLLAQDHPDFEVIVVDDGSTDRTVAIAEQRGGRGPVRVHPNDGAGVAAARNTGLRVATGELVAYIDCDGYAQPDWLARVCGRLEGDASLGAAASLVFFDAGPNVVNGAGGTMDVRGHARDICFGEPIDSARLPGEVLYPMGNGMALRRAALEAVGGFDETLRYEYEDAEAGIRLWRDGWRIVLEPSAMIDHGYQQGLGGHDRPQLHQRHRIRTMLAHAPARSLPRWLAGELPWLLIPTEVRQILRRAWAWNALHLHEALLIRWRQRRAPPVPRHLIIAGRGKIPRATETPGGGWLYGWYLPRTGPRGVWRWGCRRAGRLIEAEEGFRGVRIDYRLAPRSPGARMELRPAGTLEPLAALDLPAAGGWRTATLEATVEPGPHEVVLTSDYAYVDAQMRELAVAVSSLEPIE